MNNKWIAGAALLLVSLLIMWVPEEEPATMNWTADICTGPEVKCYGK